MLPERLLSQVEPCRRIEARGPIELLEEQVVVGRVDDDSDARKVLRSGADHRGTADVDVFHGFEERNTLGDLVLEGIEVHHHHIKRDDLVVVESLHVPRVITSGGTSRGPSGAMSSRARRGSRGGHALVPPSVA